MPEEIELQDSHNASGAIDKSEFVNVLGQYNLPDIKDDVAFIEQYLCENALKKLYEGCPREPTTKNRDEFLNSLNTIMQHHKQKQAWRHRNIKRLFGRRVLKWYKRTIGRRSISIKKLLGKKKTASGKTPMQVYQEAIAEEFNSEAFRRAVFIKSLDIRQGKKLRNRQAIWVAGPSGAGKTTAAESVVDRLLEQAGDDEIGENVFVKIDGSTAREISKIRGWLLDAGLSLGHSKVAALHKNTKAPGKNKKIKDLVHQAINHRDNPAILHPEIMATFTNGIPKQQFSKYAADPNTDQVFVNVQPASYGIVKTMAQARDKRKDWSEQPYKITPDRKKRPCESKAYGGIVSYISGRIQTFRAARAMRKADKKAVFYKVDSHLQTVRLGKNGWKKCFSFMPGATVMSKGDLKTWQKYRKDFGPLPAKEWWADIRSKRAFTKPTITQVGKTKPKQHSRFKKALHSMSQSKQSNRKSEQQYNTLTSAYDNTRQHVNAEQLENNNIANIMVENIANSCVNNLNQDNAKNDYAYNSINKTIEKNNSSRVRLRKDGDDVMFKSIDSVVGDDVIEIMAQCTIETGDPEPVISGKNLQVAQKLMKCIIERARTLNKEVNPKLSAELQAKLARANNILSRSKNPGIR